MGMLPHGEMGAITGKGIGSNGGGTGLGKGNGAALTPHGIAAGSAGVQFQTAHPPHGPVGGGATAALMRA